MVLGGFNGGDGTATNRDDGALKVSLRDGLAVCIQVCVDARSDYADDCSVRHTGGIKQADGLCDVASNCEWRATAKPQLRVPCLSLLS